MENNQKPEWFELADNDQPVSRPLRKKSAPIRNLTFILAGILVIPMGAGFALLTHEDHSAVAAETLNLTQDSPVATNSAIAQQGNTIAMPTASRDDDEGDDDYDYRAPVFSNTSSVSPSALAPIAAVAAAKAPAAITPPAASASNDIILPPTKKGDDDDDDDDDDHDDDHDDHQKSHGKKSKDSDDDEEDDD